MASLFFAMPMCVAERTDISAASKMVYGSMLGYQGQYYHCFASLNKIARRAGLDEKTVRRSIRALVEAGLIEPVMVRKSQDDGTVIQFQQRGGKDGGKTKCWRCLVLMPKKPAERHGIKRVK